MNKYPLRIVLRAFEKARIQTPQLSAFEYLARELENLIQIGPDEIRSLLNHILSYGHAVLAFDGLDEILNTDKRRDFVDLVTDFTNLFPLCPVIVTSRMVGYQHAPMPDDFEKMALRRFDEKQIHTYVVKQICVLEGKSKKDAEPQAEKFIEQTNSTAYDLRQNPLMLGLMAFLFSVTGDVPTSRTTIYQECALSTPE